MTKRQAISKQILDAIGSFADANGLAGNDGAAVRAGVDRVLGEGTYDRIAGEIYDELRAR